MSDKPPKLHTFLEDETGGYSSRRAIQIVWFVMLVTLVTYLTIIQKAFPILPDNYWYLSIGLVLGGVASKYVEKKPIAEIVKDIVSEDKK